MWVLLNVLRLLLGFPIDIFFCFPSNFPIPWMTGCHTTARGRLQLSSLPIRCHRNWRSVALYSSRRPSSLALGKPPKYPPPNDPTGFGGQKLHRNQAINKETQELHPSKAQEIGFEAILSNHFGKAACEQFFNSTATWAGGPSTSRASHHLSRDWKWKIYGRCFSIGTTIPLVQ